MSGMVCSLRCVYTTETRDRKRQDWKGRKKEAKKERKKEREKFKNTKKTEVDERLTNYVSLFANLVHVDFFVCFVFCCITSFANMIINSKK